MPALKKIVVFSVFMGCCAYAASMIDAHMNFEKVAEQLAQKTGSDIVAELSKLNPTCRAVARVDSVRVESDWPLADKADVSVYLSGAGRRALALDYRAEASGEKVYLKPKSSAEITQTLVQFGLSNCS